MAKIDQPEHRLSHWVKVLIERIVDEPHWATAVDTGTYMHAASQAQRFAREAHRDFMGIGRSHLDWYIYGCASRIYTQFELKYGSGRASSTQETTLQLLRDRQIPTGVYNSVMGVFAHLRDAGFRLHGNAENIATEIEARWRAADEKARGPALIKPKRNKAAVNKPTAGQLKRLAAIRASGVRF